MDRHALRRSRQTGFTLVELTIVVLMLAVLAALAMPRISQGTTDSKTAAAATSANAVVTQIALFADRNGRFPSVDELDPTWFAGGTLPRNPFRPDVNVVTSANIEVDLSSNAAMTHPRFKVIRSSAGGSLLYWYNPTNGRFRVLVSDVGLPSENMRLYNAANGVSLPENDYLRIRD